MNNNVVKMTEVKGEVGVNSKGVSSTQSFTRRFSTILPKVRRLTLKWANFGSGGPFEIFKKRKTIRIEFPKDLARLQTP